VALYDGFSYLKPLRGGQEKAHVSHEVPAAKDDIQKYGYH